MKDYTSYMLAEILKGTFKAYGSAYGHGVSGVNISAKTGTGTYGQEIYEKYNLPDNAAKDVWINGFSPEYTMSVWMGFNKVKQYGTNSFIGHSEQDYPQYLYEDVMSSISSKDGEDFKSLMMYKEVHRTVYLYQVILIIILLTVVFMEVAIHLLHQMVALTQHQVETTRIVRMVPVKVTQAMHLHVCSI